jgi:hypothetical protein
MNINNCGSVSFCDVESEFPISEMKLKRPFCCPVCNGQGLTSRPPWVAGDVNQWIASGTCAYSCRACNGVGVIWG